MSTSVVLPGSERSHPADARCAGLINGEQVICLTLVLRRKTAAPGISEIDKQITAEEHEAVYGAADEDIAAVQAFAHAHAFAVKHVVKAARTVRIEGRIAELARVFGADLQLSHYRGKQLRTRTGSLQVPAQLKNIITAVFGFDERPTASTDRRVQPRAAAQRSFSPRELAALYNFPTNTGAGQVIALVELGGGFNAADLAAYWSAVGVSGVAVNAISVDGAQNAPSGDPNSADGEVVLDIEVAGAVAPGAEIDVYFAENTDQGFLNAINGAVHNTQNKPAVISISWGSAEANWTGQAMNAFNAAFHDAALLGISVCVAAGDNGSSDGVTDGKAHVDFPASSPWVLACGGTRLSTANGRITSETVWNDGVNGGSTGGGVSSHFSRPSYQAAIHVPKPSGTHNTTGRGVPDIAAVADPATGYETYVDGQAVVVGGTSAVAPLWAGLIALCNQELGYTVGWFHPVLYRSGLNSGATRDVVSGTNGAFRAAQGWDCCTGLGSPNGLALLSLFRANPKK